MKIACFLDTNILVYAAAGKKREPEKYKTSRDVIAAGGFGLSGQVLAEFYVNVMDKSRNPIPAAEIDEWFELLTRYPVADVDAALVQRGIAIARRYTIHYFDAALIAAAERLEAPILYTEDLNHGQLYGSVRVINPFRPS